MSELYAHQLATADFFSRVPRGFDTSDPGTGKTLAALEAYRRTQTGKLLVLAPLSILEPAWGNDIRQFTEFNYRVAHGRKREEAMRASSNIVITNHDAVKWVIKDLSMLEGFSHVVVDEFTAFKHQRSERSKALKQITNRIPNVWLLSGTPNGNSILDIWYPTLLLDRGHRLGKTYSGFRFQACEPIQCGPEATHVRWQEKPGIADAVADLLKDITIRHKFIDCVDIPENVTRTIMLDMPTWLKEKYQRFLGTSFLATEAGHLNAINAGSLVKKALQLLSGAVYDSDGETLRVHDNRYQLVAQLCDEREHCLVAYNWHHELDALIKWADKYKHTHAIINGSVSKKQRETAVARFQAGEIKTLFAHPQAASHGLTLTRGTTTIWCSPTYNAEHYQQFNRRIYRNGQTQKTETIRIAYKDSQEIEVYERLDNKLSRIEDLLALFEEFAGSAA